jgi:hypothetical protein
MLKGLDCPSLFSYLCTMKKLTVSKQSFTQMLSGLIASGVTFEATENPRGQIVIEFTGGF